MAFTTLLPAPLSCLPRCSPSSPPASYIPSCGALSSNNFFVSWFDESPCRTVSKMEQRCPVPRGGRAGEEEGTGSCTCQADSGFKIAEKQNGTWEAIHLHYRAQALSTVEAEKRLERTSFTQVPSMSTLWDAQLRQHLL